MRVEVITLDQTKRALQEGKPGLWADGFYWMFIRRSETVVASSHEVINQKKLYFIEISYPIWEGMSPRVKGVNFSLKMPN
jgi:hypothetical protein